LVKKGKKKSDETKKRFVCLVSLLIVALNLNTAGQNPNTRKRSNAARATDELPSPQVGTGKVLSDAETAGSSNERIADANAAHSIGISTRAWRARAENPEVACSGLVINPTFDSSITGNPNSAAIQAMINQAVTIYHSLFTDSITVSILFRYSTTAPNGSPLGTGTLAMSTFVFYSVPWNTYINALTADAKTSNDTTANASLPAVPLSMNVLPSSAGGRAIGLNTPGTMGADGSLGGGTFDGIVTINSAKPFQFNRPPTPGNFDALRSTEHEMDEVLGFGSFLNVGGTDLRPQDLFSWLSPGVRNITSVGSRYFSIDNGNTNIVGFNQNSSGDFGDWLSGSCPQATPYVQNAFSCSGQFSDVTATSPEGINLDVIGYDLAQLRIDSVSPPAGRASGGQQITLTGSFVNLSTVTMGGVAATWSPNGPTQIIVTTPVHAVGAVDITLTPTLGCTYTKINAFAYLPTIFTDNTLMVGVTKVKAQHIIELRQAVDALRAVAGLGPAPWTDPTLSPFSTVIQAVHILELRSFLEDAASRLGYPAGPGYTDPGLTSGFVIKRAHVEDLRQRIRMIAG